VSRKFNKQDAISYVTSLRRLLKCLAVVLDYEVAKRLQSGVSTYMTILCHLLKDSASSPFTNSNAT